jgi:hypothetical protein
MRLSGAKSAFVFVFFIVLACAEDQELPEDANLELFIETAAKCAYIERAYSHDDDLFSEELAEIAIPAGLDSILDSLFSTYGAEPDFWHQVYSEILERSRK